MTNKIGTGDAGNIPPAAVSGKGLPIRPGTVVRAEVMDVPEDGSAVLRIMSSGGRETIIKAFTEVPLTKGQNIYLEVLGSGNNVRMHFIGDIKEPATPLQQNVPVRFLAMLAGLSASRPGNPEFKELLNMLSSLPGNIKAAIPELEGLEKLLLGAKQIDGNILRAFIETSGVAFETRMKIAVLSDPGSVLRGLMALQTEGDLKGILLRLKGLLKGKDVVKTLRQAGVKASEMLEMIERFTRNIEFFQLTSKINDMFYTFLPLLWDGLKDSEFLFRRDKHEKRDAYVCDINLDLEKIGKLSVSVNVMEKAFYVAFFAERAEVAAFINSEKKLLEDRFASQGLALKGITVHHKKDIVFGRVQPRGVSIRT
ncbi:MAG: flagellar hook-length control protein FliK [Nitrospiraceae bacterium]|nr:MAG: flagellar hook-length control protein FliK [Nitrospiraceae bacterium]